MERRTFFLGAATAWGAMQVMGANDRVNVAVVGVGGRGKAHVGYYMKISDAKVAALCDIDTAQMERGNAIVQKAGGEKPKNYQDLRKLYADKDIDAVSIATPNHWHALATIWACQAGKDVYCEKPASYNIFEGNQMVAAARKYKRMVQIGMQSRSMDHKIQAVDRLRKGAIGEVYLAKGLCFKRRPSIGHKDDSPIPPGVDWDLFLGPAPYRPFNELRFKYNWHWFWDTGNGDIGNQGIHEMDVARWGLGRDLPMGGVSTGGKYVYHDDQETPNTQMSTSNYGDAEVMFEVRGLNTGGEANIAMSQGPNVIGDIFLGSKGYMSLDDKGFEIFLGDHREPGEALKSQIPHGGDTIPHMENFLAAVKSRNYQDLHAEVAIGVASVKLVHIANISYRLKRELKWDPKTEDFHDREANAMKTRPVYRKPYVVPEKV